nr:ATP-grasp fold amidoligase family protein [Neobacillus sp. Marseille-Q6967]
MKKRTRLIKRKTKINKIFNLKAKFKRRHGYHLNLVSPRTFSEKIQWIKLYGNLQRFSKYVDKYEVREYVKSKIGEKSLIPLIGVYNNVNQINLDTLPDSFVLKATHGCKWNMLIKDKTKFNWNAKKKLVRKWLNSSYYRITGESNYQNIKPRVVIEEYIKDSSGDLKDYKIFCFNGEPRYIQVDGNRYRDHKRDIYDLNWNKLPVQYGYPNFSKPVDKPSRLNELLDTARILSADFPFVRVDLYCTNEQIFFGELTFTPTNGFKPFNPRHYDLLFGKFFDIKRYL